MCSGLVVWWVMEIILFFMFWNCCDSCESCGRLLNLENISSVLLGWVVDRLVSIRIGLVCGMISRLSSDSCMVNLWVNRLLLFRLWMNSLGVLLSSCMMCLIFLCGLVWCVFFLVWVLLWCRVLFRCR